MFPSITTVIGAGVPKPALVRWGPKMVARYVIENLAEVVADAASLPEVAREKKLKEAPTRYTEARGKRGDEVHAWAEWYGGWQLGERLDEPEVPEASQAALIGLKMFLNDWKPEFVHVEKTVVNKTKGYAGTFDFIAWLNVHGVGRVLCLGDYKTSKGVYPEVGLQLAAVRYAEVMLTPDGDGYREDPVPGVAMCVEVHILDGDYDVIPIEAGPDQFLAFRAAIAVRHFQEVTSRRTVGKPVLPGTDEGRSFVLPNGSVPNRKAS